MASITQQEEGNKSRGVIVNLREDDQDGKKPCDAGAGAGDTSADKSNSNLLKTETPTRSTKVIDGTRVLSIKEGGVLCEPDLLITPRKLPHSTTAKSTPFPAFPQSREADATSREAIKKKMMVAMDASMKVVASKDHCSNRSLRKNNQSEEEGCSYTVKDAVAAAASASPMMSSSFHKKKRNNQGATSLRQLQQPPPATVPGATSVGPNNIHRLFVGANKDHHGRRGLNSAVEGKTVNDAVSSVDSPTASISRLKKKSNNQGPTSDGIPIQPTAFRSSEVTSPESVILSLSGQDGRRDLRTSGDYEAESEKAQDRNNAAATSLQKSVKGLRQQQQQPATVPGATSFGPSNIRSRQYSDNMGEHLSTSAVRSATQEIALPSEPPQVVQASLVLEEEEGHEQLQQKMAAMQKGFMVQMEAMQEKLARMDAMEQELNQLRVSNTRTHGVVVAEPVADLPETIPGGDTTKEDSGKSKSKSKKIKVWGGMKFSFPGSKATAKSSSASDNSKDKKIKTSTSSSKKKNIKKRSGATKSASSSTEETAVTAVLVHPNIEAAKMFVSNYNNPTTTREQFASIWVCDTKKRYKFEDGMAFAPIDIMGMLQGTRQSFPDFHMTYENIQVQGKNTVTIEGAHCQGTHTGAAFSPGEGFPPIERTNIAVKNDEERIWLEFDDETGKINACHCYSLGDKSGPVGFYEQIAVGPGRN